MSMYTYSVLMIRQEFKAGPTNANLRVEVKATDSNHAKIVAEGQYPGYKANGGGTRKN